MFSIAVLLFGTAFSDSTTGRCKRCAGYPSTLPPPTPTPPCSRLTGWNGRRARSSSKFHLIATIRSGGRIPAGMVLVLPRAMSCLISRETLATGRRDGQGQEASNMRGGREETDPGENVEVSLTGPRSTLPRGLCSIFISLSRRRMPCPTPPPPCSPAAGGETWSPVLVSTWHDGDMCMYCVNRA